MADAKPDRWITWIALTAEGMGAVVRSGMTG